MNKMRHALVGMTIGLSVVLVSFASVPAANAVVIYNEAGDGDLSSSSGSPNFNLVEGPNTVIGLWTRTGVNDPADGDGFRVTLLPGLQIDSIDLTIVDLQNGDTLTIGLGFDPGNLFDSAFKACSSFFNCQTGTSASFMDNDAPGIGPLDTTLANSTWDFGFVGGAILNFNGVGWTVDIQTSVFGEPPPRVPEPTTLALFVIGLAGLGFMTRRRRTGVGKTRHAS